MPGAGFVHNLAERVCSNLDPFCSSAHGAKLFDSNASPSLTFHSRQLFTVTTDASGNAMIWVTANPQKCIMEATFSSGVVASWLEESNSFYTLVGTSMNSFRVVSYGVRFNTTQSYMTATGTLVASETSQNYDSTIVGQNPLSTNLGLTVKTMPLRDASLQWFGRPRGVESTEYQQTWGADLAYTQLLLGFSGTASANIGYLEVIINYEWMPGTNTPFAAWATPAAPHIPEVINARSNVASSVDAIQAAGSHLNNFNGVIGEAKTTLTTMANTTANLASLASVVYPQARGVAVAARGVAGALSH